MQGKNKVEILITATAKGVKATTQKAGNAIKAGYDRGRKAVRAFNDTVGNGHKAVGLLSGSIKSLIAGVLGFQAIRNATNLIKDADQAAFSMKTSVAAANREFENVGTVREWEETVRRLSGELRIYADTALKSAISRTVDMTKRLGLSRGQMEEVIKRSADLGAGKVELEGAIERVTAALRGEAESAEFLGLTLNENYVKAQYEANKANRKAWKDLTDLEKAQARYVEFLKQSAEMQGRTNKYAETFAGTLAEIKAEIVNTVTGSKDVNEAMQQVAGTLKENSGRIGELVGLLIRAAAKTVEFAVKWKNLLIALAGTAAAVSVVLKLTAAVKGLNAAFVALTGTGALAWLKNVGGALKNLVTRAGLAGSAIRVGLAGAATWGIAKMIELAYAIHKASEAANVAADAHDNLIENSDRMIEKFKAFKDVKLPEDIVGTAPEQLDELAESLAKARVYWQAMVGKMEALEDEEGLKQAVSRLKEVAEAYKQVAAEKARAAAGEEARDQPARPDAEESLAGLDEQYDTARIAAENYYAAIEARSKSTDMPEVERLRQALFLRQAQVAEAAMLADQEAAEKIRAVKESSLAEKEAASEIKKINEDLADAKKQAYQDSLNALRQSLDEALALERKYSEEVKRLKQELADLELSLQDKIRALRQRDMTEEEREADLALQAEEKIAASTEALESGDADQARKLAQQAGDIAYGLQNTEQAIGLLTRAAEAEKGVLEGQISAAEKNMAAARAAADEIAADMAEVRAGIEEDPITVTFEVNSAEVDAVLDRLERVQERGIEIGVGSSSSDIKGYAAGGLIPGYGGGDNILTLSEGGEYRIRKEAVRKYGVPLYDALNSMSLPEADTGVSRFALSGQVDPSETVNLNVNLGGNTHQATMDKDVAEALKRALGMEYLKTGGRRPSWGG